MSYQFGKPVCYRTTTRSKTARVTRSKVAAQSKTKDAKPYNVHKKIKPVAAAPIQPRLQEGLFCTHVRI